VQETLNEYIYFPSSYFFIDDWIINIGYIDKTLNNIVEDLIYV